MIEYPMATIEALTNRERQVAAAVARGLTNRQIAMEFGISAETVKRHLASIYSKTGLRGRVGLAIEVVRARRDPMAHDGTADRKIA
jgi:DNA-binding NarL/FixJ family response regulator